VILWDNATYHTSAETMSVVSRLGLQVLYSGPYSYSAAPVETLFSALKSRELNIESFPTGKR
jgi:transposase